MIRKFVSEVFCRETAFCLLLSIAVSGPLGIVLKRRAEARGVRVRCAVPGYVVCDFWTTSNEVVYCVWGTQWTGAGMITTQSVVTNKLWAAP